MGDSNERVSEMAALVIDDNDAMNRLAERVYRIVGNFSLGKDPTNGTPSEQAFYLVCAVMVDLRDNGLTHPQPTPTEE